VEETAREFLARARGVLDVRPQIGVQFRKVAGVAENADKRAYELTQELMDGKHATLRTGIV